MALQAIAICCDLVHNTNYSDNGKGMILFDVLGTIIDLISECIMTFVVLMLANGWYTRFKTYDFEDGFFTYSPLLLCIIFMHVIFGSLIYID